MKHNHPDVPDRNHPARVARVARASETDPPPWGNAIVVKAFVPGPPHPDDLRCAEAAVARALGSGAVEIVGWFERLEELPKREETMGQ